MKKILLLALSLGALSAQAQKSNADAALAPLRDIAPEGRSVQVIQSTTYQTEASTVVWSENFAGGFPAGWIQIDSSNINPWKWSLNGSRGFFNGPGAGQPSPGIQSTTRTNGFLLNDPDSANHFTYGQPSGNTYQYLSSYVQTSKITGLAATPFLKLEFQQHFRMNNEVSPLVQLSTDSTTWTTINIRQLVASNAASPDPMLISLNITNILNGQNQLWIRFGWSARVYYWMIDDIQLRTLEDNDLAIEDIGLANANRVINYAQLPLRQLSANYTPEVMLFNNGSLAQPNTRLEAAFYNTAGVAIASGTSPVLSSFAAGSRDTLETAAISTANLVPGNYVLRYHVRSDSVDFNPLDNRDSLRLLVGDTVMALDGHNKRISFSGTNSFTGGTDGLIFANYFELRQPDTITSVTVLLSAQTRPGALLVASVRDTSGEFTNPASLPVLLESEIYSITRQDSMAGRAIIPIPTRLSDGTPQNVVLQPGDYFVGIEMYSNNDVNRVRILDDESIEQPFYAAIIFMPGDRWYSNGNAWGIRANFNRVGAALALAKTSTVKAIKTYPNPQIAGAGIVVSLELERAGDWQLEVYDAMGRRFQVPVKIEKTASHYQFDISTEGLAAGIYHLRLSNGTEVVNQKLSLY